MNIEEKQKKRKKNNIKGVFITGRIIHSRDMRENAYSEIQAENFLASLQSTASNGEAQEDQILHARYQLSCEHISTAILMYKFNR